VTVPPEILEAAFDAIAKSTAAEFKSVYGQAAKWHAVVAVQAAAPLIAAAERERIRQLAFMESATYYAVDPATGLSVLLDFADLLGDS
jgi:hypothetical protein